MIKSILCVLTLISFGSSYATVGIGSEDLYDDEGNRVGRAEYYADVYDENGRYVMAVKENEVVEKRQPENSERSGKESMLEKD